MKWPPPELYEKGGGNAVPHALTEEESERLPLKGSTPEGVIVPNYTSEPVSVVVQKEADDPYAKWEPYRSRVLALVALPAFLPPVTSTMYLPTLNVVINDLETTEEMVAFTLSAYALAVGLCPLAWGPMSDRYGRRIVLLICLSIFIASALLAGFAWNVYILILARILQGVGLSAAGTVGAGSIADVYPPAIRGNAMGWYSVTVLLGTVLGPVLGGVVGELLGWRTIFWSLSGVALIMALMAFFFLPDTLNRNGPKKSASPIQVLKIFLHPPITIAALINASTFAIMFLFLFILPIKLENLYGFSEIAIGLSYLPFGLGNCLGTVAGGRAADYCYAKNGTPARLIPVLASSVLITVATIAMGWYLERNLTFMLVATFIFGFLLTFSRPGLTTFAIEQRPQSASSVQASIYSFQFQYTFFIVNFGPSIIERTSVELVFSVLAFSVLAMCVPLVGLMYWALYRPSTSATDK